jgi:hypothetical protein
MISWLDSTSTRPLRRKLVLAYDHQHQLQYSYREDPKDTFYVSNDILEEARATGEVILFNQAGKEAVAYHYTTTAPAGDGGGW